MVQLVELHHILLLIFMWLISLPRSRRRLRGRHRRCLPSETDHPCQDLRSVLTEPAAEH